MFHYTSEEENHLWKQKAEAKMMRNAVYEFKDNELDRNLILHVPSRYGHGDYSLRNHGAEVQDLVTAGYSADEV